MKRSKRVLALLLICMLCLQLLPAATMAASSADCDHDWQAGRYVSEATCTEPAQRVYTCRRCGATKRASYGRALGHLWDGGTVTHYPKCTEYGEKKYACMRCGATRTSSYAEPLGHDWDEWTEWEQKDGVYVRSHTCKRCGITESEEDPDGMGGGSADHLQLDYVAGSAQMITINDASYVQFGFCVTNMSIFTVTFEGIDSAADPDDGNKDTAAETRFKLNGVSTTMEPSESINGYLYVPVSPNDSSIGTVTRNVSVYGYTIGNTIPSNTETFTFSLPKGPEFVPMDSLYLEEVSVSPNGLEAGQTVSVELHLTNKGIRTVRYDGTVSLNVLGVCPPGDKCTNQGNTKLESQESLVLLFDIVITPDDIACGKVIRFLTCEGLIPDTGASISSNTVLFELELGDEPEPDPPALHLECVSCDGAFMMGTSKRALFTWRLTNNSDETIWLGSPTVLDPNHGNANDAGHYSFLYGNNVTSTKLGPHESYTGQLHFIISPSDVHDATRLVTISGTGVDTDQQVTSNEATFSYPLDKPVPDTLTLVFISVSGYTSYDGNDYVDFTFQLFHSGPNTVRLTGRSVHDPNNGNSYESENVSVSYENGKNELGPNESINGVLRVKISPNDVQIGQCCRNVIIEGEVYAFDHAAVNSNKVLFPCTLGATPTDPDPDPELPKLSVSMVESSHPARSFYVAGEQVEYTVTVTNTGAYPISNLAVTDKLDPSEAVINTYPTLNPGEPWTFKYTYTVQPGDIPKSPLVNVTRVTGTEPMHYSTVNYSSNRVTVELGHSIPPVDPKLDLCAVSLAVGEEGTLAYVVSHCTEHTAVAEKAEALLEEAGDDTEARLNAYNEIAGLWTDCVNGLYDRILAVAETDIVRMIVTGDRDAFFSWLDAYTAFLTEQYPDQPELVAEKRAELLQEKCAELCWFIRSRADALPDSLLEQVVPVNGIGECSMELKTDRTDLLAYALNFCPEHSTAAADLHKVLGAILDGDGDIDAFRQVRLSWEDLAVQAEHAFTGPAAEAEQAAYAVYKQAHTVFVRLFRSTAADCEDVLVKLALTRTLRLCSMEENDEPQGGAAPTFVDLF